jgi:hypothetical protein
MEKSAQAVEKKRVASAPLRKRVRKNLKTKGMNEHEGVCGGLEQTTLRGGTYTLGQPCKSLKRKGLQDEHPGSD